MMSKRAKAAFRVKSWDEKPYNEIKSELELTRASVVYAYEGDLEGEGHVEYLMAYRPDGTASFVGQQRVMGRLAGRPGSFLFQHSGVFASGAVSDTWTVIPGSGTGELAGLQGKVLFSGGHAERYPFIFSYEFEG